MGFFDGFFDPTYDVVYKGNSQTISGKKVLTLRNNLDLVRLNSSELFLHGDLPIALKRRGNLEASDNIKWYRTVKELIHDAYDLGMTQENMVRTIADQLGIDFFYKNLSPGALVIKDKDRDDSMYGDEYFIGGRPLDVNNLYFDYTLTEDLYDDGIEYNYTYINAYKKEEFQPDTYFYWLKDGDYFISGGFLLDEKGKRNHYASVCSDIVSLMFNKYSKSFFNILNDINLKIGLSEFEYKGFLDLEKRSYSSGDVDLKNRAKLVKDSIYVTK